MQIQINTDHSIKGHETMAKTMSDIVEKSLSRVSEHLTRVEVHLSDENGRKSGPDDKRCTLEARLENHQPISVSNHSDSLEQAVRGACKKLLRLIDSTLGRIHTPNHYSSSKDSVAETEELS